jgi:hypothetical protein
MQRERQLARLIQEPQAFVNHARTGRGFHALVGFSRPHRGSMRALSDASPLRDNVVRQTHHPEYNRRVGTRSVDYRRFRNKPGEDRIVSSPTDVSGQPGKTAPLAV